MILCVFSFIEMIQQNVVNDDAAERVERRRTFGNSRRAPSNDDLIEEHEELELQNCLKIFQDNVSCEFGFICVMFDDSTVNLL